MPDLAIVAIIAVVVLFGGTQVPKIARALGSAKHEFNKGQREGETVESKPSEPKSINPDDRV